MAGPRDWTQDRSDAWSSRDEKALQRWSERQRAGRAPSPSALRSYGHPSRPSGTGVGPWGPALLSAGIGLSAVLVALSPLIERDPGGHGYVFTTIGITAILFGILALRRNRLTRSVGITASASVGIGLGAIACLAMLGVMVTAHDATAGANALPFGSATLNGMDEGTAAGATDVTLTSLTVVGSGRPLVVVGNGGSIRLTAGYSVRSTVRDPAIDVRLERRVGTGDWSATGVVASSHGGGALTAVTPPYSTLAATETVEYRFASSTSTSAIVSVVYENQRAYTGMAATIYGYAAPYCPATAVHIADLEGREAGDYSTGALLIRVDPRVGDTVNVTPASQRTLALHECSHELQWLNYGGTDSGRKQMEAAAATYFAEGASGSAPLEHAADCGALALEPNGYLGYGGYCTPTQLAEGRKLLGGQRY